MKKSVCGVHRPMLGVSWETPKKLAVLTQHPVAGVLMSQGSFQIQDFIYEVPNVGLVAYQERVKRCWNSEVNPFHA